MQPTVTAGGKFLILSGYTRSGVPHEIDLVSDLVNVGRRVNAILLACIVLGRVITVIIYHLCYCLRTERSWGKILRGARSCGTAVRSSNPSLKWRERIGSNTDAGDNTEVGQFWSLD